MALLLIVYSLRFHDIVYVNCPSDCVCMLALTPNPTQPHWKFGTMKYLLFTYPLGSVIVSVGDIKQLPRKDETGHHSQQGK